MELTDKQKIHVKLAGPEDQKIWDSFVDTTPEAGPYHRYAWKLAVERVYGQKGYYLMACAAQENGNVCLGVLPLICIRLPWGKNALISLPYCDYGGPLGNAEAKKAMLLNCQELAKEIGAKYIEIRCASKEEVIEESSVWVQEQHHKVRLLLKLPGTSEELWDGFKSKLRSQIRRPQKEGFYSVLGGSELLEDFYKVFSVNMRDLGSPVHAKEWFENLVDKNGENVLLGVVYSDDKIPVAGGILLFSGNRVCVPWASMLREYRRAAPNMLLYWSFLEWSTNQTFAEFDFGRSTEGEGTYVFKKQWGAKPRELFWHKQGVAGRNIKKMEDTKVQDSPCRMAAEKVWRKLPLSVANFIGSRIRGYIPL